MTDVLSEAGKHRLISNEQNFIPGMDFRIPSGENDLLVTENRCDDTFVGKNQVSDCFIIPWAFIGNIRFNKNKGTNLVAVTPVHVEPYGAYSKKVTKVADLAKGAIIAIPNDPSNGGRALVLLEQNGLIKLKDSRNILSTVKDIVENKKGFKIKELEAATLPRVLDQVDLALINTNYAIEAKLVPTRDALFIEDSKSPYANLLVSRPDNKDSDAVKKLVAALHSEDAKKFIETKYQGAVVPAF